MQQTETYKLNLIESSDPFLPDALNENTRKIEEVVSGSLGDMDERIKVFEAKRFACGTCTANNVETPNVVELGFTPVAVAIHYCRGSDGATALSVTGVPANTGLDIIEGGFQFNIGSGYNIRAGLYSYIALG